MHFCKILNYFTIWLVIFGIFEKAVALYSVIIGFLFYTVKQ